MGQETYTCDMCHRVFEKHWSDAEALSEMQDMFGDIPPEHCSVLCNDCYEFITTGHNDLIEHYNRCHNPHWSRRSRFGCLKADCWWRLHPDDE